MMSKGCSVHVFCFKGESMMSGWRKRDDACTSVVQVGDYVMIWIDSLELILPKDGYETLCVEESSLRKLKELCHGLKRSISLGRGKWLQVVADSLGLRNIKAVTGIRVRYV
jgi:hypothetical protein